MFEIDRVRDRERKIGYSLHKGTGTLVRDRERFEIEGVRDRKSQLYFINLVSPQLPQGLRMINVSESFVVCLVKFGKEER